MVPIALSFCPRRALCLAWCACASRSLYRASLYVYIGARDDVPRAARVTQSRAARPGRAAPRCAGPTGPLARGDHV